MKLLKVTFSLLTLLVLLAITAVIVIPQIIDPNDYKDDITAQVKQKTGLDLRIDGQLSLSIFPWLGVNTGHVVLSQPESIKKMVRNAGALADVDAIDIKVKLKPLFSRRVEVDTILLKKPRIHLIVSPSGQNSLDSLLAANQQAQPQKTSTQTHSSNSTITSSEKGIAALTITGINISDGQIVYDDRQTNTRYELKQVNITGGNILDNTNAPFSVSGNISSGTIATTTFSLNTKMHFNPDNAHLSLNNVKASIQQANNTVDATIAYINYQHQTASNSIRNINLLGNANNTPFSLSIPEVSIDFKNTQASIPTINASSLGIELSSQLSIKNWNGMGIAIGTIKSNTFNAKTLFEKLEIDYTPTHASALEKVSFSTEFNGTHNGLFLKKTNIHIDNSQLTGELAAINFSQPNYRFDLSLNQIIINHYLPEAEQNNTSTEKQDSISATEVLSSPIALLQHIHANGIFRAQKITANNIKLNNTVLTIASDKDNIVITPQVELYNGKLDGKITIDRKKNSSLSMVSQLTDVNLEPLLTDAEITDQFSGIGNLKTNITVNNKNNNASSKGTILLSAKNGAIKGVDIKQVLDDTQAKVDRLRGKDVAESTATEDDETRFAEMTATLLLDNDVITNNDLSIKAPAFRISGNGSVNIAQQTLDYLTSIIVVNTNSGQGGANIDKLKGATIPVRFTGSLSAPSYKIDTRALIKANTQKAANKKKEELKRKALKKLGIEGTSSKEGTQKTTKEIKDELKEKVKKSFFDRLFR